MSSSPGPGDPKRSRPRATTKNVARVIATRATLFHVEHVLAAASYAGIALESDQISHLQSYADWLRSEGHRSGGIGPDESPRLERRHIADSLLFASQLGRQEEVWDLGTGVGFPGVPLAIAMPSTRFVLVDRSGRRIDLLRRVIRILDLENCEARQAEIEDVEGPIDAMVARASLPPAVMADTARRILSQTGLAVIGGSWWERPEHSGWTTVEIPQDVLDQTVWLLIMRRQ